MKHIPNLADHIAPDSIRSLEVAAQDRFQDAQLFHNQRMLMAIYLYGYCAEMILAAALFRHRGYQPHVAIDRDTRLRTMSQARRTLDESGNPLMDSEPHPIVGWARLLRWQRVAVTDIDSQDMKRLNQAVKFADKIYHHWRPELRYKTTQATIDQLECVRSCTAWLLHKHAQL